MEFPKDFINKIVCGDVLEVMKQIPDGTVDLVVTSPPYNLKNSTGNGMKDVAAGNGPMPLCKMATLIMTIVCLMKSMCSGRGTVWKK